jgi:ABC-type transporter Mla subunit MlaD
MRKLLDNASLAAERLANAANRLPGLLTSLQTTVRRAGNGTSDLEQGLGPLLRDLQGAVQNLRELTDSLRRYPAQILSQPPPRAGGSAR